MWIEEVDEAGRVFRIRATSSGYDVEWSGLAFMHVGETTTFRASEGADARAIEKLRRGPARGVERYLRGTGVGLHASAVALQGRGVLFLGGSGAGKSTLCAHLVARGAELLADDVVLVSATASGVVVEPTEGEHLLDAGACSLLDVRPSDQLGQKRVVRPERVAVAAVPLLACVELVVGTLGIERLTGMQAMVPLAKARLCPQLNDPERTLRDFDSLAELAKTPVFRMHRPERGGLSQLRELTMQLVEAS
jgi:serine kinase of HPr protein (carbohydrate metabolism regulator)